MGNMKTLAIIGLAGLGLFMLSKYGKAQQQPTGTQQSAYTVESAQPINPAISETVIHVGQRVKLVPNSIPQGSNGLGTVVTIPASPEGLWGIRLDNGNMWYGLSTFIES